MYVLISLVVFLLWTQSDIVIIKGVPFTRVHVYWATLLKYCGWRKKKKVFYFQEIIVCVILVRNSGWGVSLMTKLLRHVQPHAKPLMHDGH